MADLAYPKRPAFFAMKVIRAMAKTCFANEYGPDAFSLVAVIAATEDASHYRRPVSFWTHQIMPICGLSSESTFKRVRERAVASGWLVYIPGAKRQPPRYFVQIPEHAIELDDAPSDEGDDLTENGVQMGSTGEPESGLNPDTKTKWGPPVNQNPDLMWTSSGPDVDLKWTSSGPDVDLKWTESIPVPVPVPVPVPEDPPNPPQGGTTPLPPDGGSGVSVSEQDNPVRLVFEHYRKHHPRSFPKPSSNSKEWKAIRARLNEGYTVADLCEAIDGCHKSPWHCGENERNRPFQALELIVRSADKVNQFVEIARKPVAPVLKESEIRSRRAVDQVLSKMFPKGGDS